MTPARQGTRPERYRRVADRTRRVPHAELGPGEASATSRDLKTGHSLKVSNHRLAIFFFEKAQAEVENGHNQEGLVRSGSVLARHHDRRRPGLATYRYRVGTQRNDVQLGDELEQICQFAISGDLCRSVRSLAIAANQPRICSSTLKIVVPISSGARGEQSAVKPRVASLSVYLRTVKW